MDPYSPELLDSAPDPGVPGVKIALQFKITVNWNIIKYAPFYIFTIF
jgi:hypothetical protein